MSTLTQLLSLEAIALGVAAADAGEAVVAAGVLLAETGAATTEYATELLAAADGSVVVAPGVALVSSVSPEVRHDGLAWVALSAPVRFADGPAQTVVALAATRPGLADTVAGELAAAVADPARRAALASAQTSAEVLDVLGLRARAVEVTTTGLGTVTGASLAGGRSPAAPADEEVAPQRNPRSWWRRWFGR